MKVVWPNEFKLSHKILLIIISFLLIFGLQRIFCELDFQPSGCDFWNGFEITGFNDGAAQIIIIMLLISYFGTIFTSVAFINKLNMALVISVIIALLASLPTIIILSLNDSACFCLTGSALYQYRITYAWMAAFGAIVGAILNVFTVKYFHVRATRPHN